MNNYKDEDYLTSGSEFTSEDNNDNSSDEDDDERYDMREIKKRRKKDGVNRKDDNIYGIFNSSYASTNNNSNSYGGSGGGGKLRWKNNNFNDNTTIRNRNKGISFVKSTTASSTSTKNDQTATSKQEAAIEENEEERLKKEKSKEANDKFMSLLNRSKKGNTKRSLSLAADETTSSSSSADRVTKKSKILEKASINDFISSSGGIGYNSSSNSNKSNNNSNIKIDPNLAKWEKHTKGIGTKLLAMMGFKGSGGLKSNIATKNTTTAAKINSSSLSKPIEVLVRPTNLGLGYGGFQEANVINNKLDEKKKSLKIEFEDNDNDNIEVKEGKDKYNSILNSVLNNASLKQTQPKSKSKQKLSKEKETIEDDKEQDKSIKIIDMRGPITTTIQTDTTNISSTILKTATQSHQPPPLGEELLYNMSLLVNTYESNIIMNKNEQEKYKQQIHSLTHTNATTITKNINNISVSINYHTIINNFINEIEDEQKDDNSNDYYSNKISEFIIKYPSDNNKYDKLWNIIIELNVFPILFTPIIKQNLFKEQQQKDNNFKNNPQTIIDFYAYWNHLFSSITVISKENNDMDDATATTTTALSSIMTSIINQIVFNYLSNEINNWNWNFKENHNIEELDYYEKNIEPFLRLIDALDKNTTTQDITKTLMHDTIYPKLLYTISNYTITPSSKLNNSTNFHTWIIPWLSHMHKYTSILEYKEILTAIRKKIKNVLLKNNTTISDLQFTFNLLLPWKDILSKTKVLDVMIIDIIMPRLARLLHRIDLSKFVIEYNKNDYNYNNMNSSTTTTTTITPMKILLQYYKSNLLPTLYFESLLEGEILHRLCYTIQSWLLQSSSKNNNDKNTIIKKVIKTYYAYKSYMPKEILLDDRLCSYFHVILLMIHNYNCTTTTTTIPTIKSLSSSQWNYQYIIQIRKNILKQEQNEKEHISQSNSTDRYYVRSSATSSSNNAYLSSFKEIIEKKAFENDIIFQPTLPSTYYDGKQIYKFGIVSIYFDLNVIFAFIVNNNNDGDDGKGGQNVMKKKKEWMPISLDRLLQSCK